MWYCWMIYSFLGFFFILFITEPTRRLLCGLQSGSFQWISHFARREGKIQKWFLKNPYRHNFSSRESRDRKWVVNWSLGSQYVNVLTRNLRNKNFPAKWFNVNHVKQLPNKVSNNCSIDQNFIWAFVKISRLPSVRSSDTCNARNTLRETQDCYGFYFYFFEQTRFYYSVSVSVHTLSFLLLFLCMRTRPPDRKRRDKSRHDYPSKWLLSSFHDPSKWRVTSSTDQIIAFLHRSISVNSALRFFTFLLLAPGICLKRRHHRH